LVAALAVQNRTDARAVPLVELQGELKRAGVLNDEPGLK
jgi:hypothetical protein